MNFLHHAPMVHIKSYQKELHNDYKSDFDKSLVNKFRQTNDIIPDFAYYAYCINKNKPDVFIKKNASAFFININDDITEEKLNDIFNLKTKFLCLNDDFTKDTISILLQKIFKKNYPIKSSFEQNKKENWYNMISRKFSKLKKKKDD